ncbi:glycoside hydrolase family 88 protein [Lachnoclostridium phytofermentans]|uniref:glycoside hydrolase family 88 protein n=1 Tax=Lachnoclostridium phytofermentans TaxID=66219 RepID=UPI0018DF1F95|nr:glycoside hydrolase family 88 protein [Lachnoclostridium phytofermentans]
MGDCVPWYGEDGVYHGWQEDSWVSGFWPGMLWILYDLTGRESYKQAAWEWDGRIEQCYLRNSNLHHDVGFQFLPTAVMKYKLTGDEDGRRRGLFAANFLAGRFNLAGSFIRAWNLDKIGWSIIDSTMNLSLLFWASNETKDPRFRQIGVAQAETVLKHFIRPDGSVCHILSFDPETGAFLEPLGGQGYDKDSSWSRGQAWAIYGMANVYRYTGDRRFLDAAKRVAHYFLANLEETGIPCWDFRVPHREKEPWDSSAGAIAASGLLELAEVDEWDGSFYRKAAMRLLESLTEHCGALEEVEYQGLLKHGTGEKPKGAQVDVSLIYGDYFYLEALAKLHGWNHRVF